jgi:hypothetical protein
MSQLVEMVQAAAPVASLRSFSQAINSKLQRPIAGLDSILRMISTLAGLGEETETSHREIAAQLISNARIDKIEAIDPPDQDWVRLERDIARLLDVSNSLLITNKAAMLISEHEHAFCSENTRVISDIRAIFPSGEITSPAGAVIIHMLKLAYHQGDDDKEFYIALDEEDLRILRDSLDRAIAKEKRLREVIKSSKVPYIGIQREME